jgi:hypothetical protein
MRVIVEVQVPYANLRKIEFEDQAAAVAYLRANPSEYDYSLDNVEMFYVPTYIDVYAAMGEA